MKYQKFDPRSYETLRQQVQGTTDDSPYKYKSELVQRESDKGRLANRFFPRDPLSLPDKRQYLKIPENLFSKLGTIVSICFRTSKVRDHELGMRGWVYFRFLSSEDMPR